MQTQIKTLRLSRNRRAGFTLIEMIGVLAVIAILAAMLIPKVFQAINNARVNNAAVACSTIKSALADHYAKWNAFLIDGSSGAAVAFTTSDTQATAFDSVLLKEGFIDKPFQVKIGDGSTGTKIAVVTCLTDAAAPDGSNSAYNLDSAAPVNDAIGTVVVEAVISGVPENDAKDLNDRIDGPTPLGSVIGQNDFVGRVKYAASVGGNPVTVHIYLTHR